MVWLLGYLVVMIGVVTVVDLRRQADAAIFFVAERKVQWGFGAMSIAASWIWAPALFVSTQVGFCWGYSGLFWFVIPNMLALMMFGPFAQLVRERLPRGYSYLGYIRNKDKTFFAAQLTVQLLVQLVAFSLQLTAGAELLAHVSNTDYITVVALMAFAPLAYSLMSGISASILTDGFQYLIIVAVIGSIYFAFPLSPTHAVTALENTDILNRTMLLNFGVASALTLIFGIFADHQQWQRAFSLTQRKVAASFIGAGLLHGVVTFSLGTLGVILAGAEYTPVNQQILAAEFISGAMPQIYTGLFVLMLLCGLCSTIDSCLCAVGSLYALEMSSSASIMRNSRRAMCVLATLGFMLGVGRVPVITLWMIAGMLRLATISSTILSVFHPRFSGYAGTFSILNAIFVGGPVFMYGSFTENAPLKTAGMVLCLIVSMVTYWLVWLVLHSVAERPLGGVVLFKERFEEEIRGGGRKERRVEGGESW